MSVSTSVAPLAASLRTMCPAIAPNAPVIRIVLPERSMLIISLYSNRSSHPHNLLKSTSCTGSTHGACTHDRGRHVPLHDSELLECFDRAASFFDGLLDQFFAARLFERQTENFGFDFRRN